MSTTPTPALPNKPSLGSFIPEATVAAGALLTLFDAPIKAFLHSHSTVAAIVAAIAVIAARLSPTPLSNK